MLETNHSVEIASTLLNAAFSAGFLVRYNGKVEHLNHAARSMFGVEGDMALQLTPSPLHISTYVTLMKGDESLRWEEFLTIFETNHCSVRKSIGWRRSGESFAAEIRFAKVGNDHLAMFVRNDDRDALPGSLARILQVVSEAAADPTLIVNEKGRIQLVNDEATRNLGYGRDDIIGNNISVIVGGQSMLDQRRAIKFMIESTASDKAEQSQKMTVARKNGTEFEVEISCREIDGAGGRLFFIFLRCHTRSSQEKFTSQIIDASYTPMFVTDHNGHIVRVNMAAVKTFGCDRDELCSKTLSDILAAKYARMFHKEIDQYLRFGIPFTDDQEIEAVRHDGTTFPGSMAITCLEGSDSLAIFIHDLTTQKELTRLEIDRTAAEMLLSNMLPDKIVEELKKNPSHIAHHHESATTLFADIVGFTRMSSQMTPQEVVTMLNTLFSAFDVLVDKYDLNKIKTIGDCYMVSSVPLVKHDDTACNRVCYFAQEMLDAIGHFNTANPGYDLNLRIGINTGPAMAGVVGCTRFVYDIWGDSVNIASRMESTGVPGKIQVTEAVVKAAEGRFEFEYRGDIDVKGKGSLETYFLKKSLRAPSFSKPKGGKRAFSKRCSIGGKYENIQELLNSIHIDYESSASDCTFLDMSDDDFSIPTMRLPLTARTA